MMMWWDMPPFKEPEDEEPEGVDLDLIVIGVLLVGFGVILVITYLSGEKIW